MTGLVGNKWTYENFSPMEIIPKAVCLTSAYGEVKDFTTMPLLHLTDQIAAGTLRIQIAPHVKRQKRFRPSVDDEHDLSTRVPLFDCLLRAPCLGQRERSLDLKVERPIFEQRPERVESARTRFGLDVRDCDAALGENVFADELSQASAVTNGRNHLLRVIIFADTVEGRIDAAFGEASDLRDDITRGVIDDIHRPEPAHVVRIRLACGGDNGRSENVCGDLDGKRSNAAGSARDQNGLPSSGRSRKIKPGGNDSPKEPARSARCSGI